MMGYFVWTFLFYFILFIMEGRVPYVPECIQPMCVGGQKRVSDPLELELQMIVSCHVGWGLNPGPLHKSSKYS